MTDTSVIVLANPANELARQVVLSIDSPHTRRAYSTAITRYLNSGHSLDRTGILAWLHDLSESGMGSAAINIHLAAIRKLVWEASVRNLISATETYAISTIRSTRVKGIRLGRWTTVDGIKALLRALDGTTNETRDKAIIAILAGCGLRRAEICSLVWSQWQYISGRYVWVDVIGKGKKYRTVPCPAWCADYINQWKGESE